MSSPEHHTADELLERAEALSMQAGQDGPPAVVLEQMSRAHAIEQRLRAAGQTVRFDSPMDGPLCIELHAAAGQPPRRLSPGEAIELAIHGIQIGA